MRTHDTNDDGYRGRPDSEKKRELPQTAERQLAHGAINGQQFPEQGKHNGSEDSSGSGDRDDIYQEATKPVAGSAGGLE